jgi:hypothetical protein
MSCKSGQCYVCGKYNDYNIINDEIDPNDEYVAQCVEIVIILLMGE